MNGAGAAKTGLSWMREGNQEEEEEEEEEVGGVSVAKTKGRNVVVLRKVFAVTEGRHKLLMEATDILQKKRFHGYIAATRLLFTHAYVLISIYSQGTRRR